MARNDDENNYSESDPTQYANYGGAGGEAYSEYDSAAYSTGPTGYGQAPLPPRKPWHQKPAVLVALGVLSATILALLVFAVVKFVGSDSSKPTPAGTTATSSATSSAESAAPTTTVAPSEPSTTQSAAPAPAPTTQTVTVSPTEAPTTTVAPATTTTTVAPVTTTTVAPTPSTTTSISTSVTTVTETTTQRWLPPILRPTTPTLYQPPGQ